jgi:hypothetical protein
VTQLPPGVYPQDGIIRFAEDPIHLGDFVQGKKSTPHDGRSRRTIMLASEIAAEPGDPQHDLSQRWGLARQFGSAVHAAVQRTPFHRLQQHFTRQVAIEPGEQRRISECAS